MELTWDVYNPNSEAERILVLGPTLGGNAQHQWTPVAEKLADHARIVFVELPGHALTPVWDDADEPTLDVVAAAILDVIREVRGDSATPVVYAGVSISGAIGLHIARDYYPGDVAGVAVLCSAATVGEPQRWLERARDVEDAGTQQLIEETEKRWFTPAYRAQHRATVDAIMEGLAVADDHSYAQLCRALAVHDMRPDLDQIRCPLLLIAGERDSSTPLQNIELVAESVPGAELHVVKDASHQVTVAAPGEVAALLLSFMQRLSRHNSVPESSD